ncbi:MAG: hypothetical protein IT383_05750 [Deltaproteobacteria bacterium]|nr:hypothetical protein [Deltaproteobacteria bacterium]
MRFGSLLLAAVVAVSGFAACSYRNETINRVIDPYWRKADFDPSAPWYVRSTVVDAPPEAGWISIADGDWLMLERVRWEVTEKQLIGWRDYPVVPGSELDQYPGSEDVYRGEPVAIFAITDHFDIKTSFDSGSGEEGNEIVENRDRLWHDRSMMRVDWSTNLVKTYKWHITLERMGNPATVSQYDMADPKRFRFETDDDGKLDYFEVTTRNQMVPDPYSFFGAYGTAYLWDPAGAIIDTRHTFMRVPPSDYVAQPMPPAVALEDADGNEIRDERGFTVKVPVNDRFGFFGTLGRNTFDENRGMVTSGQIFNASRFNIWQQVKNADGSVIPVEQREPKAIVYYTNVDAPTALLPATQRVADEWNRVFCEAVYAAQPGRWPTPDDVPTMFELRQNSCNVENVTSVLGGLPAEAVARITAAAARTAANPAEVSFDGTIEQAAERVAHANDPANTEPFTQRQDEETQALTDLERICSALEYVTGGDVTLGVPPLTLEDGSEVEPFKYQRLGDTRYSMMNLIPGDFQSGWLGLGPPYADPITGETISATANVSISGLDGSAARAAKYIEVINGEVAPTDVAFGWDIERYTKQKLAQSKLLSSQKVPQRALDQMGTYFDALTARARGDVMNEGIGVVPEGRARALMERLQGTEIEQALITPDDLIAFGKVDPVAAEGATLDEAMLDAVSPLRNNDQLQQFRDREERIVRMGLRAMDPPEMVDNLIIGQAAAYKDMSYNERFAKLREDIFVAVMLHEVGHNMGLFHNMAGSSDSLNFGSMFWDLQALPEDMDDAIAALSGSSDAAATNRITQLESCIAFLDEVAASPNGDPLLTTMTTQECLRQTEVMYSSIMDYHANWNSDFGGLGPYDRAAIKFGYTNLIEVFPADALAPGFAAELSGLDAFTAERAFRRKLFLDDWRGIDDAMLKDTASVSNREHVKVDWNTSSMRIPNLDGRVIVPYKFGWGAQMTPDEKPFDFGADFAQNAELNLTRYFQGYYFSHFGRDRLLETELINMARGSDLRPMYDFTEKMQWFFYYEATDPDFRGSWREQDMMRQSIAGLNLLGQVLAHPGSGRYVTVRNQDIFSLLNKDVAERDTAPSEIALPWSNLGSCAARQVAVTGSTVGYCEGDGDCGDYSDCTGTGADCFCDTKMSQCIDRTNPDDGVFLEPQAGFRTTVVPPSEGRPFFIGLTDDYEEWYLTYVGTYWSKLLAMQLLGYNYAYLPRVDGDADGRAFDISWYRLFPEQVQKIVHAYLTDGYADVGPRIDADGNYVPFELINDDLSEPDYTGMTKILPSVAFNHQYFALLYANAYMQSPTDDTLDLPKTMFVALEGGNDDTSAFETAIAESLASGGTAEDVVAEFVHPITGLTLRGLKVGDYPIAYDMVNRINLMKDRYQVLDSCVAAFDGSNGAALDPYCRCITADINPLTGDCVAERIEVPGEGQCSAFALRNRRDSARDSMDDLVDFTSDLRTINKYLSGF